MVQCRQVGFAVATALTAARRPVARLFYAWQQRTDSTIPVGYINTVSNANTVGPFSTVGYINTVGNANINAAGPFSTVGHINTVGQANAVGLLNTVGGAGGAQAGARLHRITQIAGGAADGA